MMIDTTIQLNKLLRNLIFASFLLMFFTTASAQVYFVGGANYTGIRNNNIIEHERNIIAYQFGWAIRYYPFKNLPTLSIQNELLFNSKGYQQKLDKNYLFKFNYISLPILLQYSLTNNLSVHSGIELSELIHTNLEHGTKTYNNFDLGLVLGLSWFESKKINFYARYTYGLMPMLDYYTIDKYGNFTGTIHDLRNSCFTVGLKFKISNNEIHLYK